MPFAGQGVIRPLYFTMLASHVILAAVMVPMVLASLLGTWLGTRLLGRMRTGQFRLAFQVVLGLLGVRLLLSPWV